MQPLTYTLYRPEINIPGYPTIPEAVVVLPIADEDGVHAETCVTTYENAADLRSMGGNLTTDWGYTYNCWELTFSKLSYDTFCKLRDDLYNCQFNGHGKILLTIDDGCSDCPRVEEKCVRLSIDQQCMDNTSNNGKYINDFVMTLCECLDCDECVNYSCRAETFVPEDSAFGGISIDGVRYNINLPIDDSDAINNYLNSLGLGFFSYILIPTGQGQVSPKLFYAGPNEFGYMIIQDGLNILPVYPDCKCVDSLASEYCSGEFTLVSFDCDNTFDGLIVDGVQYDATPGISFCNESQINLFFEQIGLPSGSMNFDGSTGTFWYLGRTFKVDAFIINNVPFPMNNQCIDTIPDEVTSCLAILGLGSGGGIDVGSSTLKFRGITFNGVFYSSTPLDYITQAADIQNFLDSVTPGFTFTTTGTSNIQAVFSYTGLGQPNSIFSGSGFNTPFNCVGAEVNTCSFQSPNLSNDCTLSYILTDAGALVPDAFYNAGDVTGIESWLNGLGIGTWTYTYDGTGLGTYAGNFELVKFVYFCTDSLIESSVVCVGDGDPDVQICFEYQANGCIVIAELPAGVTISDIIITLDGVAYTDYTISGQTITGLSEEDGMFRICYNSSASIDSVIWGCEEPVSLTCFDEFEEATDYEVLELTIDGVLYNAPAGLLATDITAIQAWVDSISAGFVFSYDSGIDETSYVYTGTGVITNFRIGFLGGGLTKTKIPTCTEDCTPQNCTAEFEVGTFEFGNSPTPWVISGISVNGTIYNVPGASGNYVAQAAGTIQSWLDSLPVSNTFTWTWDEDTGFANFSSTGCGVDFLIMDDSGDMDSSTNFNVTPTCV